MHTRELVLKKKGKKRYKWLNSLKYIELSRRDDLESIAYSIIYLAKGKLPWQGLGISDSDEKCRQVYKLKKQSPDKICGGLPAPFAAFLKYCRGLAFHDKPDYSYCHKLFAGLLKEKGLKFDYVYEWTVIRYFYPRVHCVMINITYFLIYIAL